MNLMKDVHFYEHTKDMGDYEKLVFMEEVRFAIHSNEAELSTILEKDTIEDFEFYTMLDKLNTLDNHLMAKAFIDKHKYILLDELNQTADFEVQESNVDAVLHKVELL